MRDWVEILIAHELAYNFLSKVFYEPPNKVLIDTIAAEDLFEAWPLETDQTDVKTGLSLLRQYCSAWSEAELESLQQDYRKLFVGPGPLLATPWESVYRSPEHLLFDIHTAQVRRAYQRFGMPIPRLHAEPEDHLGLELRFIGHLSAIGVESFDKSKPEVTDVVIGEIRKFLTEHLLQWAPECLQRVIENASTDYYRGAAYLALGCLVYTGEIMERETVR